LLSVTVHHSFFKPLVKYSAVGVFRISRFAITPQDVTFRTKPEIALDQIRAAQADGVPPGVILADAGYGDASTFRDGLTALDLAYVVGIQGNTLAVPPGVTPEVPTRSGRGRKPTRLRSPGDAGPPVQERALAEALPEEPPPEP